MFMGEYNHTIDAKGRLIIPAKFREPLGEEFVLTRGLDGCLYIYPMDEWEVHYHLQIKTLEPFRASLLQVQQHVNWTSRGEFSYHRRYVSSLVWRKMLFWLET